MKRTHRQVVICFLPLIAGFVLCGCFSLKTQHTIDPIHITMDVNLKVQRELEDFLNLDK